MKNQLFSIKKHWHNAKVYDMLEKIPTLQLHSLKDQLIQLLAHDFSPFAAKAFTALIHSPPNERILQRISKDWGMDFVEWFSSTQSFASTNMLYNLICVNALEDNELEQNFHKHAQQAECVLRCLGEAKYSLQDLKVSFLVPYSFRNNSSHWHSFFEQFCAPMSGWKQCLQSLYGYRHHPSLYTLTLTNYEGFQNATAFVEHFPWAKTQWDFFEYTEHHAALHNSDWAVQFLTHPLNNRMDCLLVEQTNISPDNHLLQMALKQQVVVTERIDHTLGFSLVEIFAYGGLRLSEELGFFHNIPPVNYPSFAHRCVATHLEYADEFLKNKHSLYELLQHPLTLKHFIEIAPISLLKKMVAQDKKWLSWCDSAGNTLPQLIAAFKHISIVTFFQWMIETHYPWIEHRNRVGKSFRHLIDDFGVAQDDLAACDKMILLHQLGDVLGKQKDKEKRRI